MYVKALIVNVNKCLKPFSRTTYQYCKIESRFKAFGLSVAAYLTPKEKIVVIIICIHQTHYSPILTPEGSKARRDYLVVHDMEIRIKPSTSYPLYFDSTGNKNCNNLIYLSHATR